MQEQFNQSLSTPVNPPVFKTSYCKEPASVGDGDILEAGLGDVVEALSGSTVYACEHAIVVALEGARVYALTGSFVSARRGSQVFVQGEATVIAKRGSTVRIETEYATIRDARKRILGKSGVYVEYGATVTAAPASRVDMDAEAILIAERGSVVSVSNALLVEAEDDSQVYKQPGVPVNRDLRAIIFTARDMCLMQDILPPEAASPRRLDDSPRQICRAMPAADEASEPDGEPLAT